MTLTSKQEEGLKIAVDRFNKREKYTCISGYAGTGKSTLVKYIVSALGLKNEQVAYVAYTGKAANVLKNKGCPNATTAHKLLYNSRPLPNGKYIFVPKVSLDPFLRLIVVDEVSMLPKSLWDVLMRHRIHVLACGDPEQLPPINKDDTHDILDHPHIFLDQIMRQAEESEIIRLSMDIRAGKPLVPFKGKEVQVITRSELVAGMYDWADQILCATNATREQINKFVRQTHGLPADHPVPGDKIISLRNHWDELSSDANPLTNGQIGTLGEGFNLDTISLPRYIADKDVPILMGDFITEDGDIYNNITMDYNALLTGQKTLTNQEEYRMMKVERFGPPPYEFVYGYGITTWKAQGSQWKKILLFEEKFPFDAEEHRRYLYTGLTRAEEKCVIVMKG